MAVLETLNYKVRNVSENKDKSSEKSVSLNLSVIENNSKYLIHRAIVNQDNKNDKELLVQKQEVKSEQVVKNLGNKKVLDKLEQDQKIPLYGMEEELHLDLNHAHTQKKSILKNGNLLYKQHYLLPITKSQ